MGELRKYPMEMRHPEQRDAVGAPRIVLNGFDPTEPPGGFINRDYVPQENPPIVVNNEKEEAAARAKGYGTAVADQGPQYPRVIVPPGSDRSRGVLVRDASEEAALQSRWSREEQEAQARAREYPKALSIPGSDRAQQIVVSSRAEEDAQRARWKLEAAAALPARVGEPSRSRVRRSRKSRPAAA